MKQDIKDLCRDKAYEGDGLFAIAHALLEVAGAQQSLAFHVKYLGYGDAATTMGAMEASSVHLGEKIGGLTSALSTVGDALKGLE